MTDWADEKAVAFKDRWCLMSSLEHDLAATLREVREGGRRDGVMEAVEKLREWDDDPLVNDLKRALEAKL